MAGEKIIFETYVHLAVPKLEILQSIRIIVAASRLVRVDQLHIRHVDD